MQSIFYILRNNINGCLSYMQGSIPFSIISILSWDEVFSTRTLLVLRKTSRGIAMMCMTLPQLRKIEMPVKYKTILAKRICKQEMSLI